MSDKMTSDERNTYISLIETEVGRLRRETGQKRAMVYAQAVSNVHAASGRTDDANSFYNELMDAQAAVARAGMKGNGKRSAAGINPNEPSDIVAAVTAAVLKAIGGVSGPAVSAPRSKYDFNYVTIRPRIDRGGYAISVRRAIIGRDFHFMEVEDEKFSIKLARKLDETIGELLALNGGAK